MKKLLPMLLFLLVPAVSFGQGSIVNDIALKNLVTGIAPAAGATVTVCTSAGTGIPCTPLATVYSNVALTVQLTNPLTADSNGYYSFYAAAGTYIVTVTGAGTSGRTITYTLPCNPSGSCTYTNFNNVQWAGPGSTPTCDTAVSNLGGNPGTVMISSNYTGAECAALTFNAVDGSTYNIYRGSNIITIHDLRASTNKAYGVNYGGTTLGSLARFAVTQSITAPAATSSAILATQQISGTPSPGGAMAAITAELDTEGTLSGTLNNIYQVVAGQLAIRSTGGTISLVAGGEFGGGIDRASATTNITTAASVQGDAITNVSSSGAAITDAFGGRFLAQTVGTRNNMSIFSQGDFMLGDNRCFYAENGASAAVKVFCMGHDNAGTGGLNLYSNAVHGAVFKFIDNAATHFNWMIASQQNFNNVLEITKSTAAGGTTFTTTLGQFIGGAGNPALKIIGDTATTTGLLVTPGADAVDTLTLTNAAGSTNEFEFDGQGHIQTNVAANSPGGAANKYLDWKDPATNTPSWNNNNNGTSSPSGAWQCTNVTPVTLPGTSTTNDQNLMACTIPAGTLNRVGRTLRVKVKGVYSTPAASTSQMTLKLKLCTVSGCGSGTVIAPIAIQSTALGTVQITNDNFSLRSEITTQTAGASSAYEASGEFLIDLSTLATAADSEFGDPNVATVGTIDSTAQLFLQTTMAFSSASVSNVATQRQLIAETVN